MDGGLCGFRICGVARRDASERWTKLLGNYIQ
jgi:hypothetical protein